MIRAPSSASGRQALRRGPTGNRRRALLRAPTRCDGLRRKLERARRRARVGLPDQVRDEIVDLLAARQPRGRLHHPADVAGGRTRRERGSTRPRKARAACPRRARPLSTSRASAAARSTARQDRRSPSGTRSSPRAEVEGAPAIGAPRCRGTRHPARCPRRAPRRAGRQRCDERVRLGRAPWADRSAGTPCKPRFPRRVRRVDSLRLAIDARALDPCRPPLPAPRRRLLARRPGDGSARVDAAAGAALELLRRPGHGLRAGARDARGSFGERPDGTFTVVFRVARPVDKPAQTGARTGAGARGTECSRAASAVPLRIGPASLYGDIATTLPLQEAKRHTDDLRGALQTRAGLPRP